MDAWSVADIHGLQAHTSCSRRAALRERQAQPQRRRHLLPPACIPRRSSRAFHRPAPLLLGSWTARAGRRTLQRPLGPRRSVVWCYVWLRLGPLAVRTGRRAPVARRGPGRQRLGRAGRKLEPRGGMGWGVGDGRAPRGDALGRTNPGDTARHTQRTRFSSTRSSARPHARPQLTDLLKAAS